MAHLVWEVLAKIRVDLRLVSPLSVREEGTRVRKRSFSQRSPDRRSGVQDVDEGEPSESPTVTQTPKIPRTSQNISQDPGFTEEATPRTLVAQTPPLAPLRGVGDTDWVPSVPETPQDRGRDAVESSPSPEDFVEGTPEQPIETDYPRPPVYVQRRSQDSVEPIPTPEDLVEGTPEQPIDTDYPRPPVYVRQRGEDWAESITSPEASVPGTFPPTSPSSIPLHRSPDTQETVTDSDSGDTVTDEEEQAGGEEATRYESQPEEMYTLSFIRRTPGSSPMVMATPNRPPASVTSPEDMAVEPQPAVPSIQESEPMSIPTTPGEPTPRDTLSQPRVRVEPEAETQLPEAETQLSEEETQLSEEDTRPVSEMSEEEHRAILRGILQSRSVVAQYLLRMKAWNGVVLQMNNSIVESTRLMDALNQRFPQKFTRPAEPLIQHSAATHVYLFNRRFIKYVQYMGNFSYEWPKPTVKLDVWNNKKLTVYKDNSLKLSELDNPKTSSREFGDRMIMNLLLNIILSSSFYSEDWINDTRKDSVDVLLAPYTKHAVAMYTRFTSGDGTNLLISRTSFEPNGTSYLLPRKNAPNQTRMWYPVYPPVTPESATIRAILGDYAKSGCWVVPSVNLKQFWVLEYMEWIGSGAYGIVVKVNVNKIGDDWFVKGLGDAPAWEGDPFPYQEPFLNPKPELACKMVPLINSDLTDTFINEVRSMYTVAMHAKDVPWFAPIVASMITVSTPPPPQNIPVGATFSWNSFWADMARESPFDRNPPVRSLERNAVYEDVEFLVQHPEVVPGVLTKSLAERSMFVQETDASDMYGAAASSSIPDRKNYAATCMGMLLMPEVETTVRLHDYIRRPRVNDIKDYYLGIQLILATMVMNESGVVHGDMSSTNVLIWERKINLLLRSIEHVGVVLPSVKKLPHDPQEAHRYVVRIANDAPSDITTPIIIDFGGSALLGSKTEKYERMNGHPLQHVAQSKKSTDLVKTPSVFFIKTMTTTTCRAPEMTLAFMDRDTRSLDYDPKVPLSVYMKRPQRRDTVRRYDEMVDMWAVGQHCMDLWLAEGWNRWPSQIRNYFLANRSRIDALYDNPDMDLLDNALDGDDLYYYAAMMAMHAIVFGSDHFAAYNKAMAATPTVFNVFRPVTDPAKSGDLLRLIQDAIGNSFVKITKKGEVDYLREIGPGQLPLYNALRAMLQPDPRKRRKACSELDPIWETELDMMDSVPGVHLTAVARYLDTELLKMGRTKPLSVTEDSSRLRTLEERPSKNEHVARTVSIRLQPRDKRLEKPLDSYVHVSSAKPS